MGNVLRILFSKSSTDQSNAGQSSSSSRWTFVKSCPSNKVSHSDCPTDVPSNGSSTKDANKSMKWSKSKIFSRKVTKTDIVPNTSTVDESKAVSIRLSLVEPEEGSNVKQNEIDLVEDSKLQPDFNVTTDDDKLIEENIRKSPFQRDITLPPHQMLTALEKHRPRRSNIRRSTRNQNQVNNNKTTNPVSNLLAENNIEILNETTDDKGDNKNDVEPEKQNKEKEQTNETNELTSDLTENDRLDSLLIDQLDKAERIQVARSRVSQMLTRRQLLSANPNQLKTVLNADNETNEHGHTSDQLVDNKIDAQQQSTDTGGDRLDENSQHLNNSKSNESELITDLPQTTTITKSSVASPLSPSSPQLPPPTTKTQSSSVGINHLNRVGNPLLIDELKKRQSMFMQDIIVDAND